MVFSQKLADWKDELAKLFSLRNAKLEIKKPYDTILIILNFGDLTVIHLPHPKVKIYFIPLKFLFFSSSLSLFKLLHKY